jgi:hypothetical protein
MSRAVEVAERFRRECERAGFTPAVSHAPGGRVVPAVPCEDRRELVRVIRATTGRVTFEERADGFLVFPL